jgi:hypothetical protein
LPKKEIVGAKGTDVAIEELQLKPIVKVDEKVVSNVEAIIARMNEKHLAEVAAKEAKASRAAAVQTKARAYAEVRQQAGMWGGLICSA